MESKYKTSKFKKVLGTIKNKQDNERLAKFMEVQLMHVACLHAYCTCIHALCVGRHAHQDCIEAR